MNIFELIRVAWNMLKLHKLRAFLTMLGVIIGVMSVTMIVMVSNGFKTFLTGEFERLGSDTIFVMWQGSFESRADQSSEIEGLTLEDQQMILDRCPSVDIASSFVMQGSQKATYLENSLPNAEIHGVDEYAAVLNKLEIRDGRHIDETDVLNRSNVCVVGIEIAEKLFNSDPAIGKLITVPGATLEIVGVMEEFEMMGQSNKRDLWIPITTVQDKITGSDMVTMITMRPSQGYKVNETMDEVWEVLMEKSNNKKVYRIDSRESILGVFNAILGGAGAVLAGIAALSLLVGGIGIMNIMLVSVTERTREIGLRKAVGARRGAVLFQFLIEAGLLSMIGGLIGMSIAYGFGQLVTLITKQLKFMGDSGMPMVFPITAALVSCLFSALIGIVFGMYPAMRASALSPIEALRTE